MLKMESEKKSIHTNYHVPSAIGIGEPAISMEEKFVR